ncbi:hypothetical protein EVAR_91761_1 [Eumeta japonica]|uniref:Uncharacterized protein n=1 Tax=Eumeta variegata TaxID=151549 RepID=A0A4C1SD32_EUMVA|nr:hypothetical protein EVAR_91761_1 [Eumeta japonica]
MVKINAKLLKRSQIPVLRYLTVLGSLNCSDNLKDNGDGCGDTRPGIAGEGIRAEAEDRGVRSDSFSAKSTICHGRRDVELSDHFVLLY